MDHLTAICCNSEWIPDVTHAGHLMGPLRVALGSACIDSSFVEMRRPGMFLQSHSRHSRPRQWLRSSSRHTVIPNHWVDACAAILKYYVMAAQECRQHGVLLVFNQMIRSQQHTIILNQRGQCCRMWMSASSRPWHPGIMMAHRELQRLIKQ